MFDKSNQLLGLYKECLTANFKSKKPDFPVISGSISGLTSLLVNFSGDFISAQKDVELFFRFICLGALDPPEALKTYAIPTCTFDLLFDISLIILQRDLSFLLNTLLCLNNI